MPCQISKDAKLPRRSRARLPSSPAAFAVGRHTRRVQLFIARPVGPAAAGSREQMWTGRPKRVWRAVIVPHVSYLRTL
jgi:hypothetical protein